MTTPVLTRENRKFSRLDEGFREVAVDLNPLLGARVASYVGASKAASTRRAHASAWRRFAAWCDERGACALPAEAATVAAYLADATAELRPTTIGRHVAAISVAHQAAGHLSPCGDMRVRTVLAGIRRTHGTAAVKKSPLLVGELRALVGTLDDGLAGVRNRALLLLGFATALRRSELAALQLADLEHVAEGLLVHVRQSKTDQEGEGRTIAVGHGADAATCPVLATRAWIDRAQLESGPDFGPDSRPLFRRVDRHDRLLAGGLSGEAIADIVKRRVATLGLDPARFGGHSLRSGFATSAAQAGIAEGDIAEVTGHRSVVVLRGYIRRGRAFTADVVRRVGL